MFLKEYKFFNLERYKFFNLERYKFFNLERYKFFNLEKFSFTEKHLYTTIIIVFLLIGILYTSVDHVVPQRYTIVALFCIFKIVFNYRKCTFSKLECKIRNVKREDGCLNSFLDHIVDIRYSKKRYILYILMVVFLLFTKFDTFQN